MNKLLKIIVISLFLIMISLLAGSVYASERNDGKYCTIVDENNTPIWYTGWNVKVGDEFLTENNNKYIVYSVSGEQASAKLIGKVNLSAYMPPDQNTFWAQIKQLLQFSIPAQEQSKGNIAIYHTHSDESYVPTDGKESIFGNGSIYQVGKALVSSLQAKGFQVTQSEAKHDPHDNMAYERSRRTASELVTKTRPDAIFDVHRDAVPAKVYADTVNGKPITKVNLVVGKYNPTVKANEEFALNLKAAGDKQYPGLIKGIFFAKGGDYNQDLHPRSLLLEAGAHTNDRSEAENGIQLFSDLVPTVLGYTGGGGGAAATPGAAPAPGKAGQSGSFKALGWILGLTALGIVAFLVISTGSLKEAGSKLGQLTKTEFANLFVSIRRRHNYDPNKKPDKEWP